MLNKFKITYGLLFVVSTLISLILSYFLARSTTKRIDKMRIATHQITHGNYDVKLDLRGRDEISELSNDFGKMAGSLQESQEEIKRQEETPS